MDLSSFFWPFPSIRGSHSMWCFSILPVFNVFLPHNKFPHILLYYIHKSSPHPPSFPLSGYSISIILLSTYSWSLLMTCPYRHSLTSLIFIPICSTLTIPMMNSFLIFSFLVNPIVNLNIFISATSISSTCFFVTVTVSSPCSIAGFTTELYIFLFTRAGNLMSQITPDTFLHPYILPAHSSLPFSHNYHFLALLIPNT